MGGRWRRPLPHGRARVSARLSLPLARTFDPTSSRSAAWQARYTHCSLTHRSWALGRRACASCGPGRHPHAPVEHQSSALCSGSAAQEPRTPWTQSGAARRAPQSSRWAWAQPRTGVRVLERASGWPAAPARARVCAAARCPPLPTRRIAPQVAAAPARKKRSRSGRRHPGQPAEQRKRLEPKLAASGRQTAAAAGPGGSSARARPPQPSRRMRLLQVKQPRLWWSLESTAVAWRRSRSSRRTTRALQPPRQRAPLRRRPSCLRPLGRPSSAALHSAAARRQDQPSVQPRLRPAAAAVAARTAAARRSSRLASLPRVGGGRHIGGPSHTVKPSALQSNQLPTAELNACTPAALQAPASSWPAARTRHATGCGYAWQCPAARTTCRVSLVRPAVCAGNWPAKRLTDNALPPHVRSAVRAPVRAHRTAPPAGGAQPRRLCAAAAAARAGTLGTPVRQRAWPQMPNRSPRGQPQSSPFCFPNQPSPRSTTLCCRGRWTCRSRHTALSRPWASCTHSWPSSGGRAAAASKARRGCGTKRQGSMCVAVVCWQN